MTFEGSRRKMTEESLGEFLLRNQIKFNTQKCSKNKNGIDLIVDKYDC